MQYFFTANHYNQQIAQVSMVDLLQNFQAVDKILCQLPPPVQLLDNRPDGCSLITSRGTGFSLCHHIQKGSGAYPTFYPQVTMGLSLG